MVVWGSALQAIGARQSKRYACWKEFQCCNLRIIHPFRSEGNGNGCKATRPDTHSDGSEDARSYPPAPRSKAYRTKATREGDGSNMAIRGPPFRAISTRYVINIYLTTRHTGSVKGP